MTPVARSRAASGTGYLGAIPKEVWEVLDRAWSAPISLASNYARKHDLAVAFAASIGWISTISPDGRSYSRRWHVTMEGLVALRTKETL